MPRPPLRLLLVALWLTAPVTAAAVSVERFGPWSGACEADCTLATPVEFGARLHVRPADDGGLAVVVAPLEPAPGTPVRFDFDAEAPPITVPAARWEGDSRGRVTLTDPHDRAVVLEWLPVAATTTVHWTARSGEPRAAEIPTAKAGEALAWLTEVTGRRVRVVDPEAPRTGWAEEPLAFAPALAACRDDGREIIRVRAGERWTESEDALEVMTADDGWWRCVARRDGATVTDWHALAASEEVPAGPLLTLPPAGACWVHEVLRAGDGAVVGLISYDTC
jgi:hypothetical protein